MSIFGKHGIALYYLQVNSLKGCWKSWSDDPLIDWLPTDEGLQCFFGEHKCHFLCVWCVFIRMSWVEYGLAVLQFCLGPSSFTQAKNSVGSLSTLSQNLATFQLRLATFQIFYYFVKSWVTSKNSNSPNLFTNIRATNTANTTKPLFVHNSGKCQSYKTTLYS